MKNVKIGNWQRGLHEDKLEKHRAMLDRVAKENGLDPTVLYAMANIESGFDANVGNTNYGGLFAISKKQHNGKWTDPEYNTREAIKLYRSNERTWKNRVGQDDSFSPGKAYLLHQQGAGGGTALYLARNTNQSAAQVLAPFYKGSAKKLGISPEDYVKKYVIKSNGADPNISAGDFANMWINRADALQAAYAGKEWKPAVENEPTTNTPLQGVEEEIPKPTRPYFKEISTSQAVISPRSKKKTLWQAVKTLFQKA